jgi:hypothetical protein
MRRRAAASTIALTKKRAVLSDVGTHATTQRIAK